MYVFIYLFHFLVSQPNMQGQKKWLCLFEHANKLNPATLAQAVYDEIC